MAPRAPGGERRVGLLVCGHVHPEALDVGGDYPELFTALFRNQPVRLVRFDAESGQLPASLDDCEAWITTPSRASVNDDAPWIRAIEDLVRALVAAERPFAGMCFGHQVLARACGGRVERAPGGWGVGAQRFDVVARAPWMAPRAPTFTLVASHEDQVVELPPGAQLLATAAYCPNAMFAIGPRALGLQPHPEFPAALSRRLTVLRRDLIGAEASAAALASLDAPLDRDLVAGWIARFLLG
ncbi:MAG: glutamine amidotransferase class [Acidimicrobiales bacterium]|nr:glutamine amidotransferase class [Acidimicrobiales bacterium]